MAAAPDSAVTRGLVLARLFIEAIDARDLEALETVVGDDVEFRNAAGGHSLFGREALVRIIDAASRTRLWLFRRGKEHASASDGLVRISVPIVELVGGSEIEGTAKFEIEGDAVRAFEISSELLRAS